MGGGHIRFFTPLWDLFGNILSKDSLFGRLRWACCSVYSIKAEPIEYRNAAISVFPIWSSQLCQVSIS